MPEPPPINQRRIIVGITGASGAIYAQTVIRGLLDAKIEVHLVISKYGRLLLNDELGMKALDLNELAGRANPNIVHHPVDDVGAAVASGTFRCDGMAIVPCSSNSLAMVANGLGHNLLIRAAAVTLKERRPLIICHRESPLTLIDIENMRTLTLAGAVIAPANPGWYLKPEKLSDLSDFVAARILDALHVEHNISMRWGGWST